MLLHLPTLMTCLFAVMLTAAVITTFAGLTQRIYSGFWLWVMAQWLVAAGLGLRLVFQTPGTEWTALSILLVLQWPILMLAGARRFYIRSSFPTPPAGDVLVLAGAYLGWWITMAYGASPAERITAFSLGMVIVHAYAFWVGMHVRDWRHSVPLRGLLGLLLLLSATYLPRALLGLTSWGQEPTRLDQLVVPWTLLVTTCAVLLSLYLAMLVTNERTERGLKESQRQLRLLANIDLLTDVPNRRHFSELAQQTLQLNGPQCTALMIFGIDGFQDVNEQFGHAAGDEALRLVALSARATLRTRDVLGRLGGDEFSALLPETTVRDGLRVADRIVRHLQAQRTAAADMRLTLSFGLVQLQAGETIEQAVRRADQALHEARRQGSSAVSAGPSADGQAVFTESRPLGLSSTF